MLSTILGALRAMASAVAAWVGRLRDQDLRRDGARQAELARRDVLDEVRHEAEAHRAKPKPRDPKRILDRL